MSRLPKNDNLKKHKETQVAKNTALIERALSHIKQLGGTVTMSVVSRVTHEIADRGSGEKGITAAGISKNKTYRAMVERAQADMEMHRDKEADSHVRVRNYSDGDIRMMVHALRVENETLKRKVTILTHQLRDRPRVIETTEPLPDALLRERNDLHGVLRSVVSRLLQLEVAYIDSNTSLKLAMYEETIVPKEMLEKFYTKELHENDTRFRR